MGWLAGYSYRVSIPVAHTTAGSQTNYSMSIAIDNNTATNTAGAIHCNGHCSNLTKDIRFTKSDGITPLYFNRESASGPWWVQLDSIAASGDTAFYVYYGNASAVDGSSRLAFPFCDDFELGSFALWTSAAAQWTVQGTTKYEGSYGAKVAKTTIYPALTKTQYFNSCIIRGMVRLEGVSANSFCYLSDITLNSGKLITPLEFYGGHFQYQYNNGASNLPTDTTYLASTWYKLEVAIDFEQQLFRWWVNGVSKGTAPLKPQDSNVVISTNDFITSIVLEGPYNDYDGYVDQFWIRPYIYPEPTWSASVGAEESYIPSPTKASKFSLYENDCDLLTIDVSNTPHPHALIGAGFGYRDCKHHYSHMDLSYVGGAWLENIDTSITYGFIDANGILKPLIDAEWLDQQTDLRYKAIVSKIPQLSPGQYVYLNLKDNSVPLLLQVQSIETTPTSPLKYILELGKRRQDEIDAFNAKSSLSNTYIQQFMTEIANPITNSGTLTIGDTTHGWCTPWNSGSFTIPAAVNTFENYRVTLDVSIKPSSNYTVAPAECPVYVYINGSINPFTAWNHFLLGDSVTGVDISSMVNYGSASTLQVNCMLRGDWMPAHASCSGHPTAAVSATIHAWRRISKI